MSEPQYADSDRRFVSGALFRGHDGALYFVPEDMLDQFRVFDHVVGVVETHLSGGVGADDDAGLQGTAAGPTPLQAVFTTLTLGAGRTTTDVEAMSLGHGTEPLAYVAALQGRE